tara:strand:+ start:2569 stop:3384 length:816 start_codon:yes stop_codon:yes gene_type:complete
LNNIKIIAEIGWNHMGDMSLASKFINSAASNGANVCKFQTWSEKNLKEGPWDNDGRRDIYKKAELSKDDHLHLIDECKKNNVDFLTSVFDINSLDMLSQIGVKKIKIPSHEINNSNLIKIACENFDEVIVSAGAANWDEIMSLKKFIMLDKAIILHCVSSYPCPSNIINMPKLLKLKKEFNKVGYSGHFQGIDDAITAICLGATVIEKHFTIDNNLPGRDNQFAILPPDLKKISKFRDNFLNMMNDKGLDLQESERDIYNNYRGRWSDYES